MPKKAPLGPPKPPPGPTPPPDPVTKYYKCDEAGTCVEDSSVGVKAGVAANVKVIGVTAGLWDK